MNVPLYLGPDTNTKKFSDHTQEFSQSYQNSHLSESLSISSRNLTDSLNEGSKSRPGDLVKPREFQFGVNVKGQNKDWDFKKLAGGFVDATGDIYDVQRHVAEGHALCAGLLGGQWRSKSNVVGSNWVLIDVDNSAVAKDESGNIIKDASGKAIKVHEPQMTVEEALQHPFILEHCSLMYTTASHKSDWHKFRLIFLLPEKVTDTWVLEECIKLVMGILPHDPACKDASRVFYGNTGAEFPLINPTTTLPVDWIEQSRVAAEQRRLEFEQQARAIARRRQEIKERIVAEGWDVDQLIESALSFIPSRSPGSGNYLECLTVLMALNDHYGSVEAEIVANQWSPSIPGTTWDVGRKIRSFRGRTNGITIGSLFHIARQYGFNFPTPQSPNLNWGEPDPILYEKYVEREREEERIEQALAAESFTDWFQKKVGKIVDFAFKGFGEKPKAKPVPEKDCVNLNTLDNILEYESGDRLRVWGSDAKYILDSSSTGTGKSHTVGIATPSDLGVQTIFYASPNHRNPTTETIRENYADLPVRNDGLFQDEAVTVNGHPTVRWATKGESANVLGNCPKSNLFNILSNKGYSEVLETAADNPICLSCAQRFNCAGKYPNQEPAERIEGFTFRQDRRAAFAQDRIRANINSLPIFSKSGELEGEGEKKSVALVIDEFTQVDATNITTVYASDIDATYAAIAKAKAQYFTALNKEITEIRTEILKRQAKYEELQTCPPQVDLFSKIPYAELVEEWELEIDSDRIELGKLQNDLKEIEHSEEIFRSRIKYLETGNKFSFLNQIHELLSGQIKVTSETRYGWSMSQLRELINLESDNELEHFNMSTLQSVRGILSDFAELDGIDLSELDANERRQMKRAIGMANKGLRSDHNQRQSEYILSVMPNWIKPFYEIFTGIAAGSLRIRHGELEIHEVNSRTRDVINSADKVIILDATLTPEVMAQKLGIEPEEILVVRQKPKSCRNLKIVQVQGLGHLGGDRSISKHERVTALLDALEEKHPNIGVIDYKRSKRQGDGHWFYDSRGSNEFQDNDVLVLLGDPYTDIGSLLCQYQCLTNKLVSLEDEGFQEYINHNLQSERIQAVGRLRAQIRPESELTCYCVTDKDLGYLTQYFPEACIKQLDAIKIAANAGSLTQQTHQAIFTAYKELSEAGAKITQQAIASTANISQPLISKIAADFGGWRVLKKLLLSLLDVLYRKSNNSAVALDADLEFLANTFLPELVKEGVSPAEKVKELVLIAQCVGWKELEGILARTSLEVHSKLLMSLLASLPDSFRAIFRDRVEECIEF